MRTKSKKRFTLLGIVCCLLVILSLAYAIWTREKEKLEYSEDYVVLSELPALLSFTYYDEAGWAQRLGKLTKGELTEEKLTYQSLEKVIEQLGLSVYVTYEELGKRTPVSRAEFNKVYEQVIDLLDVAHMVEPLDIIILGEDHKDDAYLTQKGYMTVAGCNEYLKQYDMFTVYTMGNAIIGIAKACQDPIMLTNVFVHTAKDETAEILFEGEEVTIALTGLNETIEDTVCDIKWQDNHVSTIYKKEDTIQGKVLSYNEKQIEIDGYGTLLFNDGIKIYKTYGTVEQLDESKLVIGNLVADFVVAEKKVCGIILREPATIDTIRVLLLNGAQPYYEDVYLSADGEYQILVDGRREIIPAGTAIKASDYCSMDTNGHLRLETTSNESEIYFSNEKQEKISLGYRGVFEVRRYEEGFGVVNELSLEEYLYGVVPSEMPASYDKEALRAQAVCARSYACIQLLKGGYAQLGAHVDDSTNYQVYNKQEEKEATSLAVQDTVGEVLKYKGDIAEAYYFSTSCGCTENISIWNIESGNGYDYLQSETLLNDGSKPDLSKEDVFSEFIQNKEIAAYDSDGAYFRWTAELNFVEPADALSQAVMERFTANPDNVAFFAADDSITDVRDVAAFGAIESLNVEERGGGGAIKKLRFQYEKGSVLISNEYNIRKILGAVQVEIIDKNGDPIQNMALLPSAYFTAIPIETGYVLYGGGYGHGIGMSQNAANGLAKTGISYTDILLKFYKDITIENVYNENL
ncbi:SpoIID/LytB domain-containing protein [Lachnospiraceae bacterium ZAX-1]